MQPYTESLVRTGKIPEADGLDNLQASYRRRAIVFLFLVGSITGEKVQKKVGMHLTL